MQTPKRPLLDFPCSFPLKAIGHNSGDFEDYVVSVIVRHLDEREEYSVSTRLSNGDRYLAVTISFTARSQEHLDSIYGELGQDSRTVFLL